MTEKRRADRLPLSELRGFILFGSALALRFGWRDPKFEPEPFSQHVTARAIQAETDLANELGLLPIELSELPDDGRRKGELISDALRCLNGSEIDWTEAKEKRFSDFIFFAEDLWARPYLTWFVVPRRSSGAPHVDQETPISRNRQAPLSDLWSLFEKWVQWHANPRVRGDFLDPAFGHLPEHFHFMNYVAEVCEPTPMGRPDGSGYRDAAGSAAASAWSLLYTAYKEGRSLSVAEAVRKAVACFDIAPPTIDRKQRMVTGELEGTILASSMDQAEKRVRKLLEEIIAREPPWQMPSALTPWDH